MLQSLSLATPGPSVGAAVLNPLVSETLASSNEHHLELVGENGGCKCWRQRGTLAVFYNRVPKCGSTTMLNYINNASQRFGFDESGTRRHFDFVQSVDFDAEHWHPGTETRHQILRQMMERAANSTNRSTLFERHMHFLGWGDMQVGDNHPLYINLLRDPGELRASSFYFERDCICQQRPGFTDARGDFQIQDEWCQREWWRRNASDWFHATPFCAVTVNQCYASKEHLSECRRRFPPGAMGGTVITDFLCGTHEACDTPDNVPTAAKLRMAKQNLRENYLWVGVLEDMTNSLNLLQELLPGLFGHMDAAFWARRHIAPDGGNPAEENAADAVPTEATFRAMREVDENLAAEYELYDYAKDVLRCKLKGCGITERPAEQTAQQAASRRAAALVAKARTAR